MKTFEQTCTKRVSWVLTTKDRPRYFSEALSRARELKGEDDELIVVDGSGGGETADIISRWGSHVDLYIHENDERDTEAFNKGVLVSRGVFFKQLTDDDVFPPDGNHKAFDVMEAHPEIDMLLCGGMKTTGTVGHPVCLPPESNFGHLPSDVLRYGASGVGFFFRRKCFAKYGLLDKGWQIADNEYVLRLIQRGGCVRFCRLFTYIHPILKHSLLQRSPISVAAEVDMMLRMVGLTERIDHNEWREGYEPVWDGGFS